MTATGSHPPARFTAAVLSRTTPRASSRNSANRSPCVGIGYVSRIFVVLCVLAVLIVSPRGAHGARTLSSSGSEVSGRVGAGIEAAMASREGKPVLMPVDQDRDVKRVSAGNEIAAGLVKSVGQVNDAVEESGELSTFVRTAALVASHISEELKTKDRGTVRQFMNRAHNTQYQPQIYLSRAKEWGCCRRCSKNQRTKPTKEIHIPNPARFVNCCPFCPLAPLPKYLDRGMGPYQYYFEDKHPTLDAKYEEEIEKFGHHPEAPPHPEPYADISNPEGLVPAEESFIEAQSSLSSSLSSSSSSQHSASASELRFDPYYSIRGMEMDREHNYVYGFPPRAGKSDKMGGSEGSESSEAADTVVYSGQLDLPPCCNVCTRKTTTLSLKHNQGCCVHCAVTYAGEPPWLTRRERYELEEDTEAAEKV